MLVVFLDNFLVGAQIIRHIIYSADNLLWIRILRSDVKHILLLSHKLCQFLILHSPAKQHARDIVAICMHNAMEAPYY